MHDVETPIAHFLNVGWGPPMPAGESFFGIEASKGCNGYYLISDGNTVPYRVWIRTPSFGMALIYAGLGTMEFGAVAASLAAGTDLPVELLLTGAAMLVVGVGFKLAVVPFHMWTPDVYQGAPAPTTAFIATVSKGAVFALLLRFFSQVDLYAYGSLLLLLGLIAVASMFVGNLLALLQDNVKRLLAYSSIAHLGYALVAFLAGGELGVAAATFYLAAYFITSLGAFGVVSVLSGPDADAEDLEEYRGLVWSHPWLSGVFAAMLLSLAGIPLTAGFVGKFYVAAAGMGAALWLPLIAPVLASTVGLYYYLRVVFALYQRPRAAEEVPVATPSPSFLGSLVLAALTLLLIWLGVYPAPVIQLIQAAVTSVT